MEFLSETEIYSINMSEDKRMLLLSIPKIGIEILDADSLKKVDSFSVMENNISNLTLSPNNRFLLFSNENYIINILDYQKKKPS